MVASFFPDLGCLADEDLATSGTQKAYVFRAMSGDLPPKYGLKYGTNVPPFWDPGIPIEEKSKKSAAWCLGIPMDSPFLDDMI